MLVRNWMQTNPVVVPSDTLVSEAKRIITENNLHALPVIDDGQLRGLVTRRDCLRAAQFVAATQNTDEFNFFVNRLRVRDLMVRRPATVDVDDTMEHVLEKGREIGVGQFPVLDQGKVVGIISANEIFTLAAHFLGAWERRSGLTIGPVTLKPGVIGRITDVIENAGAEVHAIYPIGCADPKRGGTRGECKVIVRFHAENIERVKAAVEAEGFTILESVHVKREGHDAPAALQA